MATMNKSKVSDIAKDFGMASKDILTVLAAYTDSPKKPSQVLEESEINFIFEYLTQKNQVKIETIFAESAPEKKEEPAPRQEAKPAAPAASAPKAEAKPAAPAARPAQQSKSTATQQPATRVPEKKIVDTRKVTNSTLTSMTRSCRIWRSVPATAA